MRTGKRSTLQVLDEYILQHKEELESKKVTTTELAELFSTTRCVVIRHKRKMGVSVRPCFTFTEEMNEWLRQYYPKINNNDLVTEMFNAQFNTTLSKKSIVTHANRFNIYKDRRIPQNSDSIGTVKVHAEPSRERYYVKVTDKKSNKEENWKKINWVYVPKEVYENNKEVTNCALAYALAKELSKEIKEEI